MSRRTWAWVRLVAGSTIVAALVWQLGGSAFLDGLRSVTAWSLVGALLLSAGTTVCCAWRWTALVRGMGVQLSMPDAVAAYYRSQFLNSALPGGVVGDVHRAAAAKPEEVRRYQDSATPTLFDGRQDCRIGRLLGFGDHGLVRNSTYFFLQAQACRAG